MPVACATPNPLAPLNPQPVICACVPASATCIAISVGVSVIAKEQPDKSTLDEVKAERLREFALKDVALIDNVPLLVASNPVEQTTHSVALTIISPPAPVTNNP